MSMDTSTDGTNELTIRVGCSLDYEFAQPTPVIALARVHPSRMADRLGPETLEIEPATSTSTYVDAIGNRCDRFVAPAGPVRVRFDAVVRDSGLIDAAAWGVPQRPIEALPDDVLVYLLPSRYCESDRLLQFAWDLFGGVPEGWDRVQAISTWVHEHVTFGYEHARPTKSASETLDEAQGVCRDFAHLGIALLRAVNVPARYCTGYLGDIGVPPSDGPMDFAGWSEVYLGDRWYVVDPRNLIPRMGRVLVARGRDAADVAITTTFGPNVLRSFQVWAEQPAPIG